MKKFFSLVLALVMALSLTTVAWGAYTDLASVATGSTTYADSTRTAYVLDDDLTLDGTVSLTTPIYVGAGKDVTISSTQGVVITTSLIDAIHVAAGGKLTLGAGVTIKSTAGAVLWADGGAITIAGTAITSSGTQTVAYVSGTGSLTVNSGSITATGAAKVICVDGATASATVNGGTVAATHNANIETVSVLGGTFTVDGGAVSSAASSAIAIGTTGGTVKINAGTVSTNAAGMFAAAFGYSGTIEVTGGTIKNTNAANTSVALAAPSAAVTVSGGNVQSVAVTGTGGQVKVTGGTFEVAPKAEYLADGLSIQPDGTVAATVSFSGTAGSANFVAGNEYYVLRADKTWDVVKYVAADEEDGEGNVAYFDGAANYVTCKKSDDGALMLTSGLQAGDKLLGYVKVAPVDYTLKGTKISVSAVVNCTTDFYAKGYKWVNPITGLPTYFVDSTTSGIFMLVGSEVKQVAEDTTAIYGGHVLKLNKTAFLDAAKTTKEYKCVRCGAVFQGVASKAAGVSYTTYEGGSANTNKLVVAYNAAGYNTTGYVDTTLYLIKDAAPAAEGDKVTSAQTFDAGIAMYVGMSVLAATGSAVVLKKREG